MYVLLRRHSGDGGGVADLEGKVRHCKVCRPRVCGWAAGRRGGGNDVCFCAIDAPPFGLPSLFYAELQPGNPSYHLAGQLASSDSHSGVLERAGRGEVNCAA